MKGKKTGNARQRETPVRSVAWVRARGKEKGKDPGIARSHRTACCNVRAPIGTDKDERKKTGRLPRYRTLRGKPREDKGETPGQQSVF